MSRKSKQRTKLIKDMERRHKKIMEKPEDQWTASEKHQLIFEREFIEDLYKESTSAMVLRAANKRK